MSTTLRKAYLSLLRRLGVKSFRSRSGLGYPFICHVGDFAGEIPFYKSNHSLPEISVMAAWCTTQENPLVFDIGANTGFVATQLGQRLGGLDYQIFAFEPVWSTFQKLRLSIGKLHLESRIHPICCALSDCAGISSVAFNDRESLFAQIRQDAQNPRAGQNLTWCSLLTVDSVLETLKMKPSLLKIDVEGYEAHVLRGARKLLLGPDLPAICFELN